jgi:hypothetical protein
LHILTEILKWTCTKQWRCSYLQRHEGQILDNLKKFLSIEVIKIVLDSMLYETLEWPQIAPFCISSKQIPDSLTFSRIMACIILSLSDVPDLADKINCLVTQFVWCPLPLLKLNLAFTFASFKGCLYSRSCFQLKNEA